MKEYYSKPETDIKEFLTIDVITTSNGMVPPPDEGDDEDPFAS